MRGAVEPCLALTVRGARARRWLTPTLETRKCLHLYHSWEHPRLGRCHMHLQTWYPFSAAVCLNGRLWLRAHGLIRKVPHTHRSLVTASGRALLTALVAAHEASIEKLTLALAAGKNRRAMKQFPEILLD